MSEKLNILIIDDDEINNFITKAAINECNIDAAIVEKYNGKQAIDYLLKEQNVPDCIFLDITMPVINGFEFLELFEQHYPEASSKIYMLSTSIRNIDKERALKHKNVIDYLVKPVTKDIKSSLVSQFNLTNIR